MDRYVLPGVGAYDEGVRRPRASGWYDHLQDLPETIHILVICLVCSSWALAARRAPNRVWDASRRTSSAWMSFASRSPYGLNPTPEAPDER